MRMNEAVRALVGGGIVYVVMAACSGQDAAQRAGGSGGSQMSAGGATGSGGAAAEREGGFVDALTNPVPDAHAQAVSGTRIRAKYIVSADGAKQWNGWYDSQRKEDCGFSTSADGTTRCLPGGMSTSLYFADAGCTQLLGLNLKIGACGAAVPHYITAATTDTCPARTHVRAVGAAFQGPDVYFGTPATCTKQPFATVSMTYEAYALGAEVAATDFIGATTMTD